MVWHPQQKIETGGGGEAILELPAESLREARRFILAYGRARDRPLAAGARRGPARGGARRWPELYGGAPRAAENRARSAEPGRRRPGPRVLVDAMTRTGRRCSPFASLVALRAGVRAADRAARLLLGPATSRARAARSAGTSRSSTSAPSARAQNKMTAAIRDGIQKSFPGCQWSATPDAGASDTITIEVHRFASRARRRQPGRPPSSGPSARTTRPGPHADRVRGQRGSLAAQLPRLRQREGVADAGLPGRRSSARSRDCARCPRIRAASSPRGDAQRRPGRGPSSRAGAVNR